LSASALLPCMKACTMAAGMGQMLGDATTAAKQGAPWVGIAPCRMHESVQRTAMERVKPEFQQVHPSADGRTKAALTCTKDGRPVPSAVLDKTMKARGKSERHARHWRSMYSSQFPAAAALH
jgi:hypothetical protein